MTELSRRSFLKTGSAAAAAFTIAPNTILGKKNGHVAPSDKLNIAGIGVGGIGTMNLNNMATENIVALCDVDWDHAEHTFSQYPGAKRYKDFRIMLDEMDKDIDAVLVATPDHTHCIAAATAMMHGKHVYCQKPLTHCVYESRLLTKLAKKYGVVTQMGNQGSSKPGSDLTCDYVWNGVLGEVTRVDCATNRPLWPQGLPTPSEVMPVPDTLDWDLFIGPARMRPYNKAYHPWNWRGWWDFGTGALGDMACHVMHAAFKALNLKYPIRVEGSSTPLMPDCAPSAQHVKITYPARENMPLVAMPEVDIHWYDGGLLPEYPKNWPAGRSRLWDNNAVTIIHGTKDTLVYGGCYDFEPVLLSGRKPKVPEFERRVETGHEQDWIRACKESPATRVMPKSEFSLSGPFNEMVVMGVLAIRLQGLNKPLEWDGENMKFTNIGPNEELNLKQVDFTVVDGDPKMKETDNKVNAMAYAEELIKHTYREGWKLPDMPE